MAVTLQFYELKNLLTDASELGAKKALMDSGLSKPFLTATEAYRLYGRKKVERWVAEGFIKPKKTGKRNSRVQFDRMTLETLSKSDDDLAYFNMPIALKKVA